MKPHDEAEALRLENAKLRKINAALMSRVERAIDHPNNAFGLFEVAISLDKTVRRRTLELQATLRSLERTNEALKRAKAQAEQANSFKSTFLAFVSHDLLQPLNAAKLNLSGLLEMETTPERMQLVRQVELALTSLEDLIRTLLDMSKLDAGVMRPDLSVFPIEDVLAPLRRELETVADSRGLKLRVRFCDLWVRSDPLMLKRIVQNLLNNSLRYTRRGGVLLGCRRRGDSLRIDVCDTGPGIPSDRREAIFGEFQRGAPGAPEQGGFGLGLSIVRRLAQALEHPVGLGSRVGFGSTFSVSVPIAAAVDQMTSDGREATATVSYGVDGADVLLVENEPSVAGAMKGLLERWGCHVSIASCAEEARSVVRNQPRRPDLIIADMHLDNGERGTDVIDLIQKEIEIPAPAFVVTADHTGAVAQEISARGFEILRKPVKPAELRALMAYLLA